MIVCVVKLSAYRDIFFQGRGKGRKKVVVFCKKWVETEKREFLSTCWLVYFYAGVSNAHVLSSILMLLFNGCQGGIVICRSSNTSGCESKFELILMFVSGPKLKSMIIPIFTLSE